ncbi:MAG: alpha/beta hydrolase [Acidimicrobiales bacterium]
MYGDAGVQALLGDLVASGRPSSMTLPLDEGRANFRELMLSLAEPEPGVSSVDAEVPGRAGAIPVRVYRADAAASGAPLVAFFHGGGWVFGDLDSHDPMCRGLARHSSCTVVSVDYRRAPEAAFPAAFDDCRAVVEHLSAHGGHLDGDPRRVGVAGDSAGGNLAAAVALALRGTPAAPLFQALLYPALDPAMGSPSYQQHADDDFLARSEMAWYWRRYLGPGESLPTPLAAPARAEDLSGLPPAYVVIAGNDPLRDDGAAYAERLAGAGVPVELVRHEDMVHGFLSFTKWLPAAREALAAAGAALHRGLVHQ